MVSKISDTGFWSADDAHIHHVFCPELAEWISNYFNPNELLHDFGCGLGDYLNYLYNKGFSNLIGYEGDPPEQKKFNNIIRQDLTKPFVVDSSNVLFLEVAEHVPQKYESQLLQNISNACGSGCDMIMSWGIIGQAGYGHVNCVNNNEVIKKMEALGFEFLKEKTSEIRNINLDKAPWFYNTLFVFSKK